MIKIILILTVLMPFSASALNMLQQDGLLSRGIQGFYKEISAHNRFDQLRKNQKAVLEVKQDGSIYRHIFNDQGVQLSVEMVLYMGHEINLDTFSTGEPFSESQECSFSQLEAKKSEGDAAYFTATVGCLNKRGPFLNSYKFTQGHISDGAQNYPNGLYINKIYSGVMSDGSSLLIFSGRKISAITLKTEFNL